MFQFAVILGFLFLVELGGSITGYVFREKVIFSMCLAIIYAILIHKKVIVKKSSPKNLSADCRSTVGRQSADSWLSVGRQSADCRPFVGRQLANRRPTGFARNIGYLSADSGPTVSRQSADCW